MGPMGLGGSKSDLNKGRRLQKKGTRGKVGGGKT